MKFLFFFILLILSNLCQGQEYKVDLDSLNVRMDNRDFQFNCLEKARKAHPNSVYELYIYKCAEDYDDKPFPREILKYKNLRVLIIRHFITDLPKEIDSLKNLQVLIMWTTKIKVLPNSIGNLKKLRLLDLMNTPLKELPPTMCKLTALENIVLSNTNLSYFPNFLLELPKLKIIWWWRNDCGLIPKKYPNHIKISCK